MLLAGTSVVGLVASAAAQTQPSDRTETSFDEIVVTAQKREQSLQKVPAAVTAVTGATLERMGAREFEEYFRAVPGVSAVDLGPGSKKYIIRGVNTEVLPRGDAQVQQYLDEMPLAVNGPQPDIRLYDLERVEILRGPQGTLFGSGSMSGTIRNVTAKPKLDRFEYSAEGTISGTQGSDGINRRAQAMVNAPVVAGKFAVRALGYVEHDVGYVDNIRLGLKDVNSLNTSGVRLTGLLEPSDNLSIRAMYLKQDQRSADLNQVEVNAARFDPPPIQLPGPPLRAKPATHGYLESRLPSRQNSKDDVQITNLTVDYTLPFARLTSSTSYYLRDRIDNLDFPFTPDLGAVLNQPSRAQSVHEEARLTSLDGGPIRWIAGVYYLRTKTSTTQNVQPAVQLPGGPTEPIRQTYVNRAVFGEASYELLRDVTATVGIRYADREALQVSDEARREGLKPESSSVSYKHNISWNVTPDTLLYALAASGFRGGGYNAFDRAAMRAAGVSDAQINAAPSKYESDKLWNYEIGAKSTWLDGRLTTNLAAYHIDYTGLQTQLYFPGTPFSYTANVGKAAVDGLELEVQARPVNGLVLTGSTSLARARVEQGPPADRAGPVPAARKGDALPQAPRITAAFAADYTFKLTDQFDASLRFDATHTGASVTSISSGDPNRRHLDAYTLLNLRGTIYHGPYAITAFVQNLTNEHAVLTINTISGSDIASVNRPLTAGITVKANF